MTIIMTTLAVLLLAWAIWFLTWAIRERSRANAEAERANANARRGRIVRTFNREHIFGEADYYNLVAVQRPNGTDAVLAFTDDAEADMMERAEKNPEDVKAALNG